MTFFPEVTFTQTQYFAVSFKNIVGIEWELGHLHKTKVLLQSKSKQRKSHFWQSSLRKSSLDFDIWGLETLKIQYKKVKNLTLKIPLIFQQNPHKNHLISNQNTLEEMLTHVLHCVAQANWDMNCACAFTCKRYIGKPKGSSAPALALLCPPQFNLRLACEVFAFGTGSPVKKKASYTREMAFSS